MTDVRGTAGALLNDGAIVEEIAVNGTPQLLLERPGSEPEIAAEVEYQGYRFRPWTGSLIESGAVKLAGPPEPYGTVPQLVGELREFTHAYVQLTDAAEQMAPWYALHTWTADAVGVTPYFRLLDELGRGKTRGLEVVGSMCRLPMFAAGATTPAPIFRMIQMFRGVLVMDEADSSNSELWTDLAKILNQGYVAGWPVIRAEKIGNRWEPTAYDCYGPKVLATRERFQDAALESRCLTYSMPSLSRGDIPIILPPSFATEAKRLRSKLLQYRLDKLRPAKAWTPAVYLNGLDPRLSQILEPLRHITQDPETLKQLDGFAQQYQRELIAGRGQSLAARITRAVISLHDAGKALSLGSIADETNRDGEGDEQITARKAGSIIRDNLKLVSKKVKGRYRVAWDQPRMDDLANYYGLHDDEDELVTVAQGEMSV